MHMQKEISDELALISEVVSAIPFGNVYSVPEAYFETVPSQIMSLLQTDALADPLIPAISRSSVQEVPEGYFNSLAANILKKAKASDEDAVLEIQKLSPFISTIGKSGPYHIPEGYFNQFPNSIVNTIQADEEGVPELLQDLRHKNPYTVPESYFTTVAPEILRRISTPAEAKVVKMFSFRKPMRYAAAAVIAGVILVGTLFYFQGSSDTDRLTTPQLSSFDSIPIEELETYISSQPTINTLNTSMYASSELKNEDIREILSDVPESDLQQYLVNYTDINLQNVN